MSVLKVVMSSHSPEEWVSHDALAGVLEVPLNLGGVGSLTSVELVACTDSAKSVQAVGSEVIVTVSSVVCSDESVRLFERFAVDILTIFQAQW